MDDRKRVKTKVKMIVDPRETVDHKEQDLGRRPRESMSPSREDGVWACRG